MPKARPHRESRGLTRVTCVQTLSFAIDKIEPSLVYYYYYYYYYFHFRSAHKKKNNTFITVRLTARPTYPIISCTFRHHHHRVYYCNDQCRPRFSYIHRQTPIRTFVHTYISFPALIANIFFFFITLTHPS